MAKMMMTRATDMNQWERERDHPLFANPVPSSESDEWLASAREQKLAVLATT